MITLKTDKVTEAPRYSAIVDAAIQHIQDYLERKFTEDEKNVLRYADKVHYDACYCIVTLAFEDEIPIQLFEMFNLMKDPETAFEAELKNCEVLEIHFEDNCYTWGTD